MSENDSTTTPPKQCIRCKRDLPPTLEYFYQKAVAIDGFQPRCKECMGHKFGVFKRPSLVTADGIKRCTKGDECVHPMGCMQPATLEYFRKEKRGHGGFNSRCKACLQKEKRERKAKDPDKYRKQGRMYYVANRERESERGRQYRKSHPEQVRVFCQRRLARKRSLTSTFTAQQWRDCLNWWNGCCAYCGRQRDFWNVLHQEHVKPITLGGDYTIGNIVPACISCNSRKNNTPVEEWVKRTFKGRAKQILTRIQAYFDSLQD